MWPTVGKWHTFKCTLETTHLSHSAYSFSIIQRTNLYTRAIYRLFLSFFRVCTCEKQHQRHNFLNFIWNLKNIHKINFRLRKKGFKYTVLLKCTYKCLQIRSYDFFKISLVSLINCAHYSILIICCVYHFILVCLYCLIYFCIFPPLEYCQSVIMRAEIKNKTNNNNYLITIIINMVVFTIYFELSPS